MRQASKEDMQQLGDDANAFLQCCKITPESKMTKHTPEKHRIIGTTRVVVKVPIPYFEDFSLISKALNMAICGRGELY